MPLSLDKRIHGPVLLTIDPEFSDGSRRRPFLRQTICMRRRPQRLFLSPDALAMVGAGSPTSRFRCGG